MVDHRGKRVRSPAVLHNRENDVGETTNVAGKHPDIVKRLLELAEKAREDLGDLDRPGKNRRPAGAVQDPTPRVRQPQSRDS